MMDDYGFQDDDLLDGDGDNNEDDAKLIMEINEDDVMYSDSVGKCD